jgi:subtilisin family serine protease
MSRRVSVFVAVLLFGGLLTLTMRSAMLRAASASPAPDLWPVAPAQTAAPHRVVVKMRAGVSATEATARLSRHVSAGAHGALRSSGGTRALFRRSKQAAGAKADARRARRVRRGQGAPMPSLEGTYVLDVPASMGLDAALARLHADPQVEYAQPDHAQEVQQVPLAFWETSGSWGQPYEDLWGLKKLDLEPAWQITRGEGARVAVVDSGIDRFHRDVTVFQDPREGPGLPGYDDDGNGYIDDARGWNFVDDNNDTQDRHGHGTHVAGILSATPLGNGLVGVAPNAALLAVKAVDDGGRSSSSRIAAGIVYAVDNAADVVISASACAARCPSDPVMEQAVRYAAAAGVLVVFAAGNRGDDVRFYSPQNMTDPKPLVVSATDPLDRRASFGNFGELVDLSAPGGGTNVPPPAYEPVLNILSAKSSTCAPIVCPPPLVLIGPGGTVPEYLRRAGTSMSAAHATGVAALILAAHPELSLEAVRRRLLANALDLGPAGCDAMFGCGRLTGFRSLVDTSPFVLARLLAPGPGETVDGPVPILGAAAARSLSSFEVSVGAGTAPTAWQTTGVVASGAPTSHGELAVWNTETVADGPWTIRLTVQDTSGVRREARRTVTVDNARDHRRLVVDVASVSSAVGHVHVAPPRAFCNGVASLTQTCAYSLPLGASVVLTALPGTSSTFAGWSGACSGTGTCTVTMTQLRSVRATFRPALRHRLTLTLRSAENGGELLFIVSPPGVFCRLPVCTFDYRPGTTVRLWAPLTRNFWWDPGLPCEGRGTECTLVMDRDMGVSGEFRPPPRPIVSAGPDQTVRLGTPVRLNGTASGEGEIEVAWIDGTYNVVGTTRSIELSLGLGVHDFTFRARTEFGGYADDQVRVTVIPPAP